MKETPKKKATFDELELGDLEGEDEAFIKWQDYENKALLVISRWDEWFFLQNPKENKAPNNFIKISMLTI